MTMEKSLDNRMRLLSIVICVAAMIFFVYAYDYTGKQPQLVRWQNLGYMGICFIVTFVTMGQYRRIRSYFAKKSDMIFAFRLCTYRRNEFQELVEIAVRQQDKLGEKISDIDVIFDNKRSLRLSRSDLISIPMDTVRRKLMEKYEGILLEHRDMEERLMKLRPPGYYWFWKKLLLVN